jgi:hypothetical protein
VKMRKEKKRVTRVIAALSNSYHSRHIVEALKEVCGEDNVELRVTRQQTDGWSCGYISSWWNLRLELGQRYAGVSEPMEEPAAPPAGWDNIIWLLLEARDLQPTNEGALDLQVAPLYHRAQNESFDFVNETVQHLRTQIRRLRAEQQQRAERERRRQQRPFQPVSTRWSLRVVALEKVKRKTEVEEEDNDDDLDN